MLEHGAVLRGRYLVDEVIDRGGSSLVYRGTDLELKAPVAIKAIQDGSRTLEDEALTLRCLRHTSIPRVYACFEENGAQYLVLDYVEGTRLDHLVTSVPPVVEAVVEWALQIVSTLIYLHERRPQPVVFKDLKPEHLMLDEQGTVMLLDFGVAKAPRSQGEYASLLKGAGSPGYAAPEQYAGSTTDPRSDLYGLGATLYYLLTRRVPVDSLARQQALFEGRRDPLPPLTSGIPPELVAVVARLMAVRRTDRYASAREARAALLAVRGLASLPAPSLPPPVKRPLGPRRQRVIPAALGVLCVATLGILFMLMRSAQEDGRRVRVLGMPEAAPRVSVPNVTPISVAVADSDATEVVADFFADVDSGRLDTAYARLSSAWKAHWPWDEFVQLHSSRALATEVRGMQVLERGGEQVVVLATLDYHSRGGRRTHTDVIRYVLIRESDGWKLDSGTVLPR